MGTWDLISWQCPICSSTIVGSDTCGFCGTHQPSNFTIQESPTTNTNPIEERFERIYTTEPNETKTIYD